MRRLGGDEEEKRGQSIVCPAPFGLTSFVQLISRRAVGIGYDGRKTGRRKVDCVPVFCLLYTRNTCYPNIVPTGSNERLSSEFHNSVDAETQGHTAGRSQVLGTRMTPREPENAWHA